MGAADRSEKLDNRETPDHQDLWEKVVHEDVMEKLVNLEAVEMMEKSDHGESADPTGSEQLPG